MMNEDSEAVRLKRFRDEFEQRILTTFDGKEMWYHEKWLQVNGIVRITTNDWGITVEIENENNKNFSLSGRWDVLIVHEDHLGAQYCGWSLDFECPYPEIGVNTSPFKIESKSGDDSA